MRFGFVGYGELGRQVESLLRAQRPAMEACYFDDLAHDQQLLGAVPFARHTDPEYQDVAFYVCLGYKHLKKNSKSSNNSAPWAARCRGLFTRPLS